MFAKLVAIILALGVVACALLSIRQSRMQAAHELARVRLRLIEHDARLWALRARIAQGVTPSRIREMARAIGPTRPVVVQEGPVLAPADGDLAARSPDSAR